MQCFNVFPLQSAGPGRSKGDLQTMGGNKKVTGLSILGGINDPNRSCRGSSSSAGTVGSGAPQSDALGESLNQGNLKGVVRLTRSPQLTAQAQKTCVGP